MKLQQIRNEISMRIFNAGVTRAAKKHRAAGHDYTAIDALIKRYRAGGGLTNAIQAYKLWSLQGLLEQYKPRSVIEFGSGLSTAVFGEYARATGARVLSIDENERWIANTKNLLGADSPVEMRQADRVFDRAGAGNIHYDFKTDEVFDMALIDGPSVIFDGVKYGSTPNLDVFALRALPKVVLVDVRRGTVDYMTRHHGSAFSAQLSDLFHGGQWKRADYRYFSVFERR